MVFFRQDMADFRRQLLQGQHRDECQRCHIMDQHGKPSQRIRQNLKVGITEQNFELSVRSSPYFHQFAKSYHGQDIDCVPQDWQIDLGNFCNSACVFCPPEFSSRMADQQRKLGWITQSPGKNWSKDPELRTHLIDAIAQAQGPISLHFIGGETLIIPEFKMMLKEIIDRVPDADRISVGFTTNLTIWDTEIQDILRRFGKVHVNMSIETLDRANDYVRWPSCIQDVRANLERWIETCRQQSWFPIIRVTPTWLTISRLPELIQFAKHNEIILESCDYLDKPEYLRISVLPPDRRYKLADQFESFISPENHNHTLTHNWRDQSAAVLINDRTLTHYARYLRSAPDESHLLPEAVSRLSALDGLRDHSALDYFDEYQDLFRDFGY